MNLVKIKVSKIYAGDFSEISEVLEVALAQLDGLLELKKYLLPESEYLKVNGDFPEDMIDSFDYYRLDRFEDFLALKPCTPLYSFSLASSPYTGSLIQDIVNIRVNKSRLDKSVDDALLNYIPLSDDELQRLDTVVGGIIAPLVHFIYYQFGFDSYTEVKDFSDADVVAQLYYYLDAKGLKLEDLYNKISDLLDEYTPNFPIFDEYPELEEPFFDSYGMYIQDYDKLADNLTIDGINKLLSLGINDTESCEFIITSIEDGVPLDKILENI